MSPSRESDTVRTYPPSQPLPPPPHTHTPVGQQVVHFRIQDLVVVRGGHDVADRLVHHDAHREGRVELLALQQDVAVEHLVTNLREGGGREGYAVDTDSRREEGSRAKVQLRKNLVSMGRSQRGTDPCASAPQVNEEAASPRIGPPGYLELLPVAPDGPALLHKLLALPALAIPQVGQQPLHS